MLTFNFMAPPRKKVLIITYYWPPSGGVGVLRCLKMAKYFRQFGWEPIIFTAKGAHYPSLDYSNEADIPSDITVLQQQIWEPYHLYKRFTRQKKDANVNNVFYVKDKKLGWAHQLSVWIRSNFFIPDARALWIRPSVRFLLRYLKHNPVDAIISNGPPHTNTRIATILKQKTGIPWLADFQDPWTQVDYFRLLKLTSWGKAKHERMEQEALKMANKITIVSPTWKKDLETLGAKNVSVIHWGYDPEDFASIHSQIDQKFTLTHLGIMGYDRNPKELFTALKKLCKELPDLKTDLEIKLVGQVDYSVLEAIGANGLEANTNCLGSVSRKEALQIMCNSQVLLLLLNRQLNVKGRIPGKLFEYIAADRPILGMGPEDSDAGKIIANFDRGDICAYTDVEKIKAVVRSYYLQYKNGLLANKEGVDISAFSNINLTRKLAGFLEDMLPTSKAKHLTSK